MGVVAARMGFEYWQMGVDLQGFADQKHSGWDTNSSVHSVRTAFEPSLLEVLLEGQSASRIAHRMPRLC